MSTERKPETSAARDARDDRRSEQLRALAAELIEAEQRERRRIAGILHDHLQQLLVLARIKTNQLESRLRDETSLELVQGLDAVLDELIDASRTLTAQLSPPVLHESGLSDALAWLARHFRDKHELDVSVETDASAEPAAESTRVFLFNAVSELLFNVVKHAEVKRAHVTMGRAEDDRVRVRVEDEGPGFDPTTLRRCTTVGGFGLFKIRERLEVLGGEMQIDSSPGGRTRLTLIAPIEEPDESALDEPIPLEDGAVLAVDPEMNLATVARSGEAHEIRVLLADDHEMLREGVANMLDECADIRVVGEASNGKLAVNLARSTRPDVVLMDVDMPMMNGIEATRIITRELPSTRVLGLTTHDDAHVRRRMLEAGARESLTKACPTSTLIETIRKTAREIPRVDDADAPPDV